MEQKGFTLMELLIVIVIIAILAGLAIPMYNKYKTQAIKTALMSDIRNCISEIAVSRQTRQNTSLTILLTTVQNLNLQNR